MLAPSTPKMWSTPMAARWSTMWSTTRDEHAGLASACRRLVVTSHLIVVAAPDGPLSLFDGCVYRRGGKQ